MAADEPLITDEEIGKEMDAVQTEEEALLRSIFGTHQTAIDFARRIEALVRQRLADRLLRHNFASLKIPWSNLSIAQQAARIVEGAGD